MSQQQEQIAVIGAGVIGTATALLLRDAGYPVTLFDPRGIGQAASFGNAGGIHVGAILPNAQPGIIGLALRMLLDHYGPLRLDWRYLPRITPWLIRMLLASTKSRMATTVAALADLNQQATLAWHDLAARADATSLLADRGWLKVYDNAAEYAHATAEREFMQRYNFAVEILDRSQLTDLEPNLSPGLYGGILQTGSMSLPDPAAMVRRLGDAALSRGAVFETREVSGISLREGGVTLHTDQGEHHATRAVVAAGAWSAALLRSLGRRVPLDTERGYHLMLPSPARSISRPVAWSSRRIVLCPMAEGIRLTGCVELAGLERAPNYERIRRFLPLAQQLLPGLEPRELSAWMGFRPSLPDSRPVIGTDFDGRIVYAFGHGSIGMTQGPATAQAVLALLAGQRPAFELAPFALQRFR